MKTPIALIVYNRPETTARVLAAVRAARPRRLFVIADGMASAGDITGCAAVRRLFDTIDWPCQVSRLYATTHLGIKRRVETGLEAVFAEEERAIILEDDCVADRSFFSFCDELLERHATDERVMSIAGSNLSLGQDACSTSYYYSRYALTWGWATWRRAWRHYDPGMSAWPELRDKRWLLDKLGQLYAASYWRGIFERNYLSGENWDYNWTFSCWLRDALNIVPVVNMVSNIGFGTGATHTKDAASPLAALPAQAAAFPLHHPGRVARASVADEIIEQMVYSKTSRQSLLAAARGYLKGAGP